MSHDARGICVCLAGHIVGTVGGAWVATATNGALWLFAGMLPGLVIATLGLLYTFEVGPWGQ